jgi:hypothetical protein
VIALMLAAELLAVRPGVYVPRGEACARPGATLRYDGRRLVGARGPGRVRRLGPEGFAVGVPGRGGQVWIYCRGDEVRRGVAAEPRRRS